MTTLDLSRAPRLGYYCNERGKILILWGELAPPFGIELCLAGADRERIAYRRRRSWRHDRLGWSVAEAVLALREELVLDGLALLRSYDERLAGRAAPLMRYVGPTSEREPITEPLAVLEARLVRALRRANTLPPAPLPVVPREVPAAA